jgi:hypothetical protein
VAEAFGLSFLRVFDASVAPVPSFGIAGTNPAITGLPGGGIGLVVATDNTLQVHVLDGNLQQTATNEIAFAGNSGQSSVASFGDGTFFPATERAFVDRDVILQRIGSNGEKIDEFIVIEAFSDIDTSDPDVAVVSNGQVVVTTTTTVVETGDVSLQFDIVDPATGVVQSFTIPDSAGAGGENRPARVVATADGLAIVYATRVFSFLDRDIRLRSFDLNGNQTGDELITNRIFGSTGEHDGSDDTAPEIAIGPDGSVVVTWTRSNGLDTDQMLQVVGERGDQVVGFGNQGNLQIQPLVTSFGTGQIAAYHLDDSQNALVGEHF